MKKILIPFMLIVAVEAVKPNTAQAQGEDYAISLPASQVARVKLGVSQKNSDNCAKASLPGNCTQQELCTAMNVGTPGACTAGEANAAGIRIYNDNLTARQAFITLELVKPPLASYVQRQAEIALAALRSFCLSANNTQKDNLCTSSGQSAGCGLCDAFQ